MEFLSKSPRAQDNYKVIRLMGLIPLSERPPSIYMLAVNAYIRLHKVGAAFRCAEEGLATFGADSSPQLFHKMIAMAISGRYWQSLFRFWEMRPQPDEFAPDAVKFDEALSHEVGKIKSLNARVISLLSAAEEFPDLLESEVRKRFVASLVDCVLRHNGTFGLKNNVKILALLQKIGYMDTSLYETMVIRTLQSKHPAMARTRYALEAYNLHRNQQAFQPPIRVMRTLLNYSTAAQNEEAVATLLKDWPKLHGVPLIRDSGLFMKFFASQGDVEGVMKTFNAYISTHHERHIRLFYPILHVHALLGDTDMVERWMKIMQEKYGLTPDTTCWNILLHSFQRRDDFNGALDCMSSLLEAESQPDHYTFGTVMAVVAERGDLDLMQKFITAVGSYDIPVSHAMHDSYVLALLNNNMIGEATDYVRMLTRQSGPVGKTRMWNQVLTAHALAARPAKKDRTTSIAAEMQERGVPFDSLTFSAIIRSYVNRRKTAQAARIVSRIMVQRNVRTTAFHYAIIIDGYVNEKKFGQAHKAHTEMLKRGIEPDVSSKIAMLKLHATVARGKATANQDATSQAGLRLDTPEELLEEFIASGRPKGSGKEPILYGGRFFNSLTHQAVYYDFLLRLYGQMQAFDVVSHLLKMYEVQPKTHRHETLPLGFLAFIMRLHYMRGEQKTVARYWRLSKKTAVSLAEHASVENRKLGDLKNRFPSARRLLLSRHINVLLSSLASRARHGEMLNVIKKHLERGFDLDNGNWNHYIQLIATGGRTVEAFSIAERHLISGFKGWRLERKSMSALATGQMSRDLMFQGKRGMFLRSDELVLTYKTAVRLAVAIKQLRARAPFDSSAQHKLRLLESEAPKTFAAVLDLPMAEHPIATHLLGKPVKNKGEKRSLILEV